MIHRLFIEKKPEYAVSALGIKQDIEKSLGIVVEEVREFLRYDIEGLSIEQLEKCKSIIFSEPKVDILYSENMPSLGSEYIVFGLEFLPGQYDQRADCCVQCIQLLLNCKRPIIKCARVLAFKGKLKTEEIEKIKKLLINPVECREANLNKPKTLAFEVGEIAKAYQIEGFKDFSDKAIADFHASFGFAMNIDDLCFVRDYFKREGRDPFETELKILDTYWSDHCRHTTFLTELTSVDFKGDKNHPVVKAYKKYQDVRNELYKGRSDKPECFMDMATIAAKKLKKDGILKHLDESEEINACSVNVAIEVDGKKEDYLLMFKNETHNHPTEIEPFGGAATCLGGAIRDPMSGRSYVYQGMRITGAPNPLKDPKLTLEGKLKRAVITKTAAKGFASYGNQIGVATGLVNEIYHEGYEAKRMEAGFVISSTPKKNVVREKPVKGDKVILLGGETGRDGCGGAVGSSKAQDQDSINTCGAEVQKGDALCERKIQRLFRNGNCTRLIKRCNDFGAGGVCVAVGEIADSIDINLNAVPKKYEGLSATDLAISESQERMAVVVADKDVDKFIAFADEENLDATVIATVTDSGSMRMYYDSNIVADLKRDMLNSAGIRAKQSAIVEEKKTEFLDKVEAVAKEAIKNKEFDKALEAVLSSLQVCSQKGLIEHFDSTVGAGSITVPLGGKNQLTPSSVMAALIPTEGQSSLASVCSFGYDPDLSSESPFLGAMYAVVTSVIKLAITGVALDNIYLTFQEYFKRLGKDSERWGTPLASLLGAFEAQLGLGLAAIGGKDSMSGTFEQLDVPPTLISFAVGTMEASDVISNVFTEANQQVFRLRLQRDEYGVPNFQYLKELLNALNKEILTKNITVANIVERGGVAAAVTKSSLGDDYGVAGVEAKIEDLFAPSLGDIIICANNIKALDKFKPELVGTTYGKEDEKWCEASENNLKSAYTKTLEPIFPSKPSYEVPYKEVSYNKTKSSEILNSQFSIQTQNQQFLSQYFPVLIANTIRLKRLNKPVLRLSFL